MTYKLKPITYCLIALIIALGSNIFASPEDEYKKAVSLYESGKYSEAKSAFEDCISNYPDSSFVPNSLLYLAKMEKDHEKMANYCRKIVQEYPNSNVADDALFEIGKSSMKRGLYSDAETQFKFLLDKYPTSNLIEDTYYQLGLLLIEMMDYDSAINYFNKVINDFPNSPNK